MKIKFQFLILIIISIKLTLAACGDLPRPFENKKNSQLLVDSYLRASNKLDSPKIMIVKIKKLGPPMNKLIPRAIKDEFHRRYILANITNSKKIYKDKHGIYYLIGTMIYEERQTLDNITIDIIWQVFNFSNDKLSQFSQHIEFPKWKWDSGSSEILTGLAKDVVNKTIRALPTTPPIHNKLSSSSEKLGVFVIATTNTSKNNNKILREAMEIQLAQAGFDIAKDKDTAAHILAGQFIEAPAKLGKQKVEIIWTVTNNVGTVVGTATQKKEVVVGSLMKNWVASSAIIARAAIQGIKNIILTSETYMVNVPKLRYPMPALSIEELPTPAQ